MAQVQIPIARLWALKPASLAGAAGQCNTDDEWHPTKSTQENLHPVYTAGIWRTTVRWLASVRWLTSSGRFGRGGTRRGGAIAHEPSCNEPKEPHEAEADGAEGRGNAQAQSCYTSEARTAGYCVVTLIRHLIRPVSDTWDAWGASPSRVDRWPPLDRADCEESPRLHG
jgi:hypothetical protein